ncbi:flagellar biosynthesis protein FlgF [Donghicola sp. C2-DW-16]|uniref:Flagellar basal-body rod protein FlgF n=1 Tax=Donghicola mangrovi TaxID=2729614 RepID=A0ABX2PA18_9RHOB|nr:flagellar basal body rod C-terminal domain-containing protein [Donghicola mangrovi]NVO26308.1 flagellar biosynthesis protein FlgF [Donghicola mangrovi]
MDRLIYTALNSLHNRRDSNVTLAQNLANMNVPGYRADLDNPGGTRFLDAMDQANVRAFQLEEGPAGFSEDSGFLDKTDNILDVAIADKGYFFMKPDNGGPPALTRRGDLTRGNDGILRNGAGEEMLNAQMQPINLPPFRQIVINEIGEIIIEPVDGAPGEQLNVAVLATVVPPEGTLQKGADGHIRNKNGTMPAPDQQAKVMQGTLERSNVNAIDELLSTIDNQRSFEFGMKMISETEKIDEAGTSLMQAPME